MLVEHCAGNCGSDVGLGITERQAVGFFQAFDVQNCAPAAINRSHLHEQIRAAGEHLHPLPGLSVGLQHFEGLANAGRCRVGVALSGVF